MNQLITAYPQFKNNPLERLRVKLRRMRAAQIRTSIANAESISLDQFHRDIWSFESSTQLDGREMKGQLFAKTPLDEAAIQAFGKALDEQRLELHGNYVWNPGSRILGAGFAAGDGGKQATVRTALRVLGDARLAPLDMCCCTGNRGASILAFRRIHGADEGASQVPPPGRAV